MTRGLELTPARSTARRTGRAADCVRSRTPCGEDAFDVGTAERGGDLRDLAGVTS